MRRKIARLAFIIALIGFITAIPAAGQSVVPAPFDVVRASQPELRALIAEAHLRSLTFRHLVEEIRVSGWLVFVQGGPCPEKAALGCLTQLVGTYEESRYVRAIVNFRGCHPENAMAILAHELQHAVEVASAGTVNTTADLRALFHRIGSLRTRSDSGVTYDTAAAKVVEAQVRRELSAKESSVIESWR